MSKMGGYSCVLLAAGLLAGCGGSGGDDDDDGGNVVVDGAVTGDGSTGVDATVLVDAATGGPLTVSAFYTLTGLLGYHITCDPAGICYGHTTTVNQLAAGATAPTVIGSSANGLVSNSPSSIVRDNAGSHDLGIPRPAHGDLTSWAQQGVLLLNARLTVRAAEAGSHQGKGWERFTDAAIGALSDQHHGLIFLLWGRFAQQKEALIDVRRHYTLKAPHPSPLSAHHGFIGCGHFGQLNELLAAQGKPPIDWKL